MKKPIKVFISYSHEDIDALDRLKMHLTPLLKQNQIELWNDNEIEVGAIWDKEIKKRLEDADIFIALISSSYLASNFAYEIELKKAIERHRKEELVVVPIIIRYCDWQSTPLANIQVLPSDGQPVISRSRFTDEAYYDIVKGISNVIDNINYVKEQGLDKPILDIVNQADTYSIEEVFVTSGIPNHTFVEPTEYKFIKSAILQQGRGIVIEGPSGIGKTTVTTKVLESINKNYNLLSARLESDIKRITNLSDWHKGIVVIDDFHRLSEELQNKVANYLKYLADFGDQNKKLIIVGIPNTGETLIKISFDLANRITIFKLLQAKENELFNLITKGEKALNIEFGPSQKGNIINESHGSLYIVQLLCSYILISNDIEETQKSTIQIKSRLIDVSNRILQDLAPKFEETIRLFASIGDRNDRTCIEILKEIALSEDGVLNLNYLKAKRPELKIGIKNIIEKELLKEFCAEMPESRRHLLFDHRIPAIIIDDPQLRFYLNSISIESLTSITGKSTSSSRTKVFISYSHDDDVWLKKVLLHLKHLEKKGILDLWVDKRIKVGQEWREEITKALDATKVALLLISQKFLASDFIVENELPPLLEAASENQTKIIQLVLKPCSISKFPELTKFQMLNKPSEPLSGMDEHNQDTLLVKLAETVEDTLND